MPFICFFNSTNGTVNRGLWKVIKDAAVPPYHNINKTQNTHQMCGNAFEIDSQCAT